MDEMTVNHQVMDTVKKVHDAVAAPAAIWETGSGKAFNFVAQATAMAIQDATDNLRNVSTMSTTAIGVAMTQLITSGDVRTWEPVIKVAENLVTQSATDFCHIGKAAAEVLRNFPPGPPPPAPVTPPVK